LAAAIWPTFGPASLNGPDRKNQQFARLSPHEAESPAAGDLVPISLQVPAPLRHGPFASEHTLRVLPGLAVSLFAAGLDGPRFMAVDSQGRIYVSQPRSGTILVLPDDDRNGVADRKVVYAAGLDRPHGLAFVGRDLIVAENGRLLLLSDENGDLKADTRRTLSTDLPTGGGHWTRTVVVGPDGDLYVSAGSRCNACREVDWRRAAILRFAADGGAARLFAKGLRNSVGLAFHPKTGELWASENGRDLLGDNTPPDEINRIVAGGDYGWPYCYGDRVPDPELGTPQRCRGTRPPAVELQAHSAPLGIVFGSKLHFRPQIQEMLIVAYHGSWNRTVPTGYKLVGIPFNAGRPSGPPHDLVTGWLSQGRAWGRPVDPVVGADGALYLSDDRAGAIYRIVDRSWKGRDGSLPGANVGMKIRGAVK
jgi:glucose/arabinose dehydrogenase